MFDWLDKLVKILVESVFSIEVESGLGSSVHFFVYDTIKIIILLGVMIFAISYIRSYFPAEKTKKTLSKLSGLGGNFMASLLGVVSPFCSCSTVPFFIGFVESGVPLGVTFSFLITSPIVNEAAIAILVGTFGWKIAAIYVLLGVSVGVFGGALIGKLKMERHVESYVYEMQAATIDEEKMTQKDRLLFAFGNLKDIIKRIWIFLIIGIGIGAAIHGWAPEAFLSKYAGPDNPLAVIVGVVAGVPLYSNALGTIPIAEALIGKGVGLGTALSFMMAVTALSLPEMILLRKVIKPRLIAAFVLIATFGIILTGYLFNLIGHYII